MGQRLNSHNSNLHASKRSAHMPYQHRYQFPCTTFFQIGSWIWPRGPQLLVPILDHFLLQSCPCRLPPLSLKLKLKLLTHDLSQITLCAWKQAVFKNVIQWLAYQEDIPAIPCLRTKCVYFGIGVLSMNFLFLVNAKSNSCGVLILCVHTDGGVVYMLNFFFLEHSHRGRYMRTSNQSGHERTTIQDALAKLLFFKAGTP